MIPPDIHAEIMRRLAATEKEKGVRILLAIESGSRAWGFASPNSDYDVRFIYVHPKDWYLSINVENKRDVIEYPIVDDIDLNGWELRKALRLFSKTNPAFVEWIQSPIVYMDDGFGARARALLPEVYAPAQGRVHYMSMAKSNYRTYLLNDLVPLKKYFYVLRPLLAMRWIERFNSAPPIEFARLLAVLEGETAVLGEIDALLERKKVSLEKELAPRIDALNAFIEAELARFEPVDYASGETHKAITLLDGVFKDILAQPAPGQH